MEYTDIIKEIKEMSEYVGYEMMNEFLDAYRRGEKDVVYIGYEKKLKEILKNCNWNAGHLRCAIDELENKNFKYEKAKKWFKEEIINRLSIYQSDDFPNSFLFILNNKNKIAAKIDFNKQLFKIDYDIIWCKFENFNIYQGNMRSIISNMIKEHFNLNVCYPVQVEQGYEHKDEIILRPNTILRPNINYD